MTNALAAHLPKAIFLLGPTASGKTALALALADRFPVDIISVDSALVYRDMNIGTAKPDAATLARYPHQLIDLIDPTDAYSAARFCTDARIAMTASVVRGRIPMLVGGTMLYIKALTDGLSKLPVADPDVREALAAEAEKVGWPRMHAELAKIDPVTAARLKPTDSQRVQRALEVYRLTGRVMSALYDEAKPAHDFAFRTLRIGLTTDQRDVLHRRVAERFTQMLSAGLVDELHALRKKYALHAELPSMRAVGYRQAWQFIAGEIDETALAETSIAATRQLAKRQMTWLRSMREITQADCLAAGLVAATRAQVDTFLGDAN